MFMKPHIVQNVNCDIKSVDKFFCNTNWIGPLNDENKLQVGEKNNKNWRI